MESGRAGVQPRPPLVDSLLDDSLLVDSLLDDSLPVEVEELPVEPSVSLELDEPVEPEEPDEPVEPESMPSEVPCVVATLVAVLVVSLVTESAWVDALVLVVEVAWVLAPSSTPTGSVGHAESRRMENRWGVRQIEGMIEWLVGEGRVERDRNERSRVTRTRRDGRT